MGSPSYCYRQFMKEYIHISVAYEKIAKTYTDEYLSKLREDQLEDLVRRFNNGHKMYGAFVGGMAVSNCLEVWKNNRDIINASFGAISDFLELLGVDEPDELDFVENIITEFKKCPAAGEDYYPKCIGYNKTDKTCRRPGSCSCSPYSVEEARSFNYPTILTTLKMNTNGEIIQEKNTNENI